MSVDNKDFSRSSSKSSITLKANVKESQFLSSADDILLENKEFEKTKTLLEEAHTLITKLQSEKEVLIKDLKKEKKAKDLLVLDNEILMKLVKKYKTQFQQSDDSEQ